MKNYYTAGEAIKRLGLKRSTFYHLIDTGELPRGVMIPLRKQALYPKREIDKLVEERNRILGEYEEAPERLAFMIPTREDLEQLVDIDRMVFQEETLILPEKQMARFAYNPEAVHILKDTATNMVLGGITLSPVSTSVLERLIRLEIDETQVKPEDYRPFTEGTQDCYLIGIIARPGITEKYYAGKLIYAALNYLIELLARGVIIRRIYTVATTEDGDKLAQSLHFTRLPGETKSEYEEFRRPYYLDLEAKESPSKLVSRYLNQRRNMERRRKRHMKQLQSTQKQPTYDS